MRDDPALFVVRARRLVPGRVRKGLEADLSAARAKHVDLQFAGVAALRSLADQIDTLERQLRAPDARAYDRIPLTGLVNQFDATYDRVFAVLAYQQDPLTRALEEFMEAEAERDKHVGGVTDGEA